MRHTSRLLLLLLLTGATGAALQACGQDDDQRAFEREAFSEPEGFTETTLSGEVRSRDEQDWRIAPMYQGYVEIDSPEAPPPYPNPTSGDPVQVELWITGIETVNGITVETLDPEGRPIQLYESTESPLPTGIYDFSFAPERLTRTGTLEAARGLHRIFIYDRNNNMITYGDIKVE